MLGPDWAAEEAADGLAALRAARAAEVDVVIADETTEPYGAFGLTRELKLLADAPAVIILLERAQDAWLARWAGADRWLLRPYDPFELAAAARELADERSGPGADDGEQAEETDEAEPVAG